MNSGAALHAKLLRPTCHPCFQVHSLALPTALLPDLWGLRCESENK